MLFGQALLLSLEFSFEYVAPLKKKKKKKED